jgi:hypothetical protein
MKKLYALLIGINEYQAGTGVRNLSACVNDVNAMHTFLQKQYQALLPDAAQIKVLTNAQATRHNVITAFQQHLTQANAEDVVLIYYSGHGSHGIAAPDFTNYQTDNQEQTWVLHDSRAAGNYDLADKEIAILLEKIAQSGAKIVFISDSCFSGSITKDTDFQGRFTNATNNVRPLESYLNGVYLRRPRNAHGTIDIPDVKHLALSASNDTESAYEENGKNGVFSKHLVAILEQKKGRISYSRLHTQVQAAVQAERSQHPQIEVYGGFNPNHDFLSDEIKAERNPLFYIGDKAIYIENTFFLHDESNIAGLGAILEKWNLNIALKKDKNLQFHLSIEENNLIIFDDWQQNEAIRIDRTASDWEVLFQKALISIARWDMMKNLDNPNTKINLDDIEYNLTLDVNQEKHLFTNNYVEVDYFGDGKDEKDDIAFTLKYENNTEKELYFALVRVGSAYEIVDKTKTCTTRNNAKYYDSKFFSEAAQEVEQYKLIVATAPIRVEEFIQERLPKDMLKSKGGSAFAEAKGDRLPMNDWATKMIQVRIIKKEAKKTGTTATNLGKGITLSGHPSFKAGWNKSMQNYLPNSKSVENDRLRYKILALSQHAELIDLSNKAHTKSGISENIVEFSIEQEGDLAKEPLRISINQDEYQGGFCMPFVFDGVHFLPLGDMKMDESGNITHFDISHIPNEELVSKRSLGKALKLVFFKFVNKVVPLFDTHFLRWVDYQNEAERIEAGLTPKVATSEKILLLVHGIIGDTVDMAKTFAFAKNKGYDLVLTFDYENLNTTIEENAQQLKKMLNEAGIQANSGKELTIVAHSMGGLISRYMIEHLDGHQFVDKLIMAGTPNGGSKLGSVPDAIGNMNLLLSLAVNFTPPNIGIILKRIKSVLAFSKDHLMISLAEMNEGSDFIKSLKNQAPSNNPVKYGVIAGSLEMYLKVHPEQKKLMEKIIIQIGQTLYQQDNDTAVSIEKILDVSYLQQQTVPCHHLNYFTIPESVQELEKMI